MTPPGCGRASGWPPRRRRSMGYSRLRPTSRCRDAAGAPWPLTASLRVIAGDPLVAAARVQRLVFIVTDARSGAVLRAPSGRLGAAAARWAVAARAGVAERSARARSSRLPPVTLTAPTPLICTVPDVLGARASTSATARCGSGAQRQDPVGVAAHRRSRSFGAAPLAAAVDLSLGDRAAVRTSRARREPPVDHREI